MTAQILKVVLILVGFFPLAAYGQEQAILEAFEQSRSGSPTAKVYLHTDTEVYAPGETLWFAAYLVEGTNHLPSKLSEVVHVELLDAQDAVLSRLSLKMTEGTGAGDILLGDTILTGEYFIRGYTHYQKNFDPAFIFSKSIFLVDANFAQEKSDTTEMEEVHDFH